MIKKCAQLVVSFSSLPVVCKIEIDGCKEIACNNSQVDFKSLESTTLANISEYGNWFRQEFQKVTCLSIRNVGFEQLKLHLSQAATY